MKSFFRENPTIAFGVGLATITGHVIPDYFRDTFLVGRTCTIRCAVRHRKLQLSEYGSDIGGGTKGSGHASRRHSRNAAASALAIQPYNRGRERDCYYLVPYPGKCRK